MHKFELQEEVVREPVLISASKSEINDNILHEDQFWTDQSKTLSMSFN